MASPQPDTLVLQVCAGLANRLRALVSGICLAEDLKRPLHVIWPANEPSCMARFKDLFDDTSLPSWVKVDMGPLEGESVMVLSPEDMELYVKMDSKMPMKSYGWFYNRDLPRFYAHFRQLKPIQSLYAELSNIPVLKNRPAHLVGVHIRRGDHEKARTHSTLNIFIEHMREEPSTTHFIVATDSKVERKALVEAFGANRLTFPANSLSRMTLRGIQDAVLDFVALSKTDKILGSYASSFSEMAAIYGATPLLVMKVPQPNPDL